MLGYKKIIFLLLVSCGLISNSVLASKADAVVGLIKKGINKLDDVPSPTTTGTLSHLDDATKQKLTPPNKVSNPNISEESAYWQTYAGIQVARRLGECVSNRMKAYPTYSESQAMEVCKKRYLTCKSSTSSDSIEQCIAETNKPQSFVVKPKYDHLGPTLDIRSLKTQ